MINGIRPKIVIVGSGRVTPHLAKGFGEKADIKMVNPRTLDELPTEAELYLIAVSDDAIKEVAENISGKAERGIIAHVSGATPLSAISGVRNGCGVIYPLQTFSKDSKPEYRSIPLFVEGDSKETTEKLIAYASLFSDTVFEAGSDMRLTLHVAAVFACNFTNRMLAHADTVLKDHGLDLTVLRPLINETIKKALTLSPEKAQTGPAVRHDKEVIGRHLEYLSSRPDLKYIYEILSNDIEHECH